MSERVPDPASGYAILGCGSVGYAVAQDLMNQGKDVIIFDRDKSRVEALRDQDLNAVEMDITNPEVAERVSDRPVVLILTSYVEDNKVALENLRENNRDQYIVVRAEDPVSQDELLEKGADYVINPPQVIAESALRALEAGELEYRAARLLDVIKSTGDGNMAVVIYTNPDPDSIASSMALQSIASNQDVNADILYQGDLGQQENRAFVNLLEIDLTEMESVNVADYETVALVDQPDNFDQISYDIDVLIDHNPIRNDVDIDYVDVRQNLGSTSTIMTKYLQELEVDLTEEVTTALLYGIRAETMDFRRNTTPADLTAAAYLYPFADHDLLEQVESPSMSPETLDILAESIHNREIRGSHLISNVGFINNRDALLPAAEHLLSLEGISTTVVFGVNSENIHIAARSKDVRINISRVLRDAFGNRGEIAGHSTQANASIPLGLFGGVDDSDDEESRETLLELTDEAVTKSLLESMGVEEEEG